MGLDNPFHLAILLMILLLVFGAKRLPEMGKSLGEGLRGFKDSISGDGPPASLTATAATPPHQLEDLPSVAPACPDLTTEEPPRVGTTL